MIQADLFDSLTPLELGHAMADLAGDHADRAVENWKQQAFDLFVAYSRSHKQFTTENVRAFATGLAEPPELRAWGAVALRAKRAKIIRAVGAVSAKARNVHGNLVTLWETI